MLNWLIDQVGRIWKRISSVVDLAYRWARDKAQSAYDRAQSYAYSLYRSATRFASSLVDGARSFASSLYNGAVSLARSLAASAKSLAQTLYRQALSFAAGVFDRAVAAARGLVGGVKSLAEALFKRALAEAVDLFNKAVAGARALVDGLRALALALFDRGQVELEQLRIKVGAGQPEGAATLLQFATNPAATIAAFLQSFLLDLLFWLLAVGMGRRGLDVGSPPRIPSGHRGDGGSTGGNGGRTRFGDPPSSVRAAIEEHFPSDAVNDAIAISYLESGWNASAVNDSRARAGGRCNERYTLPDGRSALTEYSVGLFQINICAHGGSYEQWADPYRNAAKAASLFRASGWAPWRYSAQALGLL